MSERIQGKVANVTRDRELIINRGSDHGVKPDMYFYIKDDPIEVTDPDSGDVIGNVTPIKVVVRVHEVAEKFCIARTFRSRRILVEEAKTGGSLYNVMGAGRLDNYLQPPRPAKFDTQVETLRLDPKKGEYISENESVVQVGDAAESVLKGEDINPVTTTLFR